MSSILLVTTLFCFTIFTTPKTILNVVASLEINNEREGLRSPEMRLAYSVCNVLFTVNYSCNFYFYCCANKEIQSAAITLLSDWKEAAALLGKTQLILFCNLMDWSTWWVGGVQ